MSRSLKIMGCLSLLVVVGAAGYWFGAQRSADVYGHAYINDAVERELFEARHDLTLAEALAENKVEAARKLAQLRYYGRLMLVAETVDKTSNPLLQAALREQIAQAKTLQQAHPVDLSTEGEQKKWARLFE